MNNSENKITDTEGINGSQLKDSGISNLKYMLVGIVFGIVFVKAEIISWYRIQEMFQLQSFFMYGVIGSAVVVGIISVQIIKRFNIKTIQGEKIEIQPKTFNKGQIYGGLLFGFGWAITGACPGPLFAQIGTGVTVIVVTLLSAIAGTWVYGLLKNKLPH
ncbi:YeeE/YedE family protein [Flavobacterium sp. GA093]|uniref:YeeE/YedE family protein n=1 Tax=Flavobacterium hydrocarbonoxydans TaxID=2683249 RepID=A0A6I4NNN9_9FLAO|nr:YeeE/YedE family protein [Flavobacterium hydrocarbonoxydans]